MKQDNHSQETKESVHEESNLGGGRNSRQSRKGEIIRNIGLRNNRQELRAVRSQPGYRQDTKTKGSSDISAISTRDQLCLGWS